MGLIDSWRERSKDWSPDNRVKNLWHLYFLVQHHGFSIEEIEQVEINNMDALMPALEDSREVVADNFNYLREFGIANYKEVFIEFAEMFLWDKSMIERIFARHDKDWLIKILAQDVSIVDKL